MLHYLVPILFLADWFLTEMHRKTSWKYIFVWLAYPIFYLIFTLVRGYFTGSYIYPFLNLNTLGTNLFVIFCFFLAGVFIGFGGLFVLSNWLLYRQLEKREK